MAGGNPSIRFSKKIRIESRCYGLLHGGEISLIFGGTCRFLSCKKKTREKAVSLRRRPARKNTLRRA